MKKNIFILTFLATIATNFSLSAVSVVYNFRIAQITRQPIINATKHQNNILSWLIFDYFQKNNHFKIKENYAGGIMTYIRNFSEKYSFRVDMAAGNTHQSINKKLSVDETESDDILFTLGRNIYNTQHATVSLSGLLGVPTHSVNTLQRVGFGTGQVGLGTQIDGIYKLAKHLDVLWGARYNYFVPRTTSDAAENYYKFTIGSIGDLLIALKTNGPWKHGLEGGYAIRWGFGIDAKPNIPNLDNLNYIRNSFFLVYKYSFQTERMAHRFLFNISYGFDSKPKDIGYNLAVMIWTAWGIAF